LVDPFGQVFDTSFAYHLIVPADIQLSPAAEKFRVWLTSEKEATVRKT